jgi:ATP-dependent Clp protease ATP-binding subunit ClpC
MRQILKNELNKVLQRRGFRQRQWAVEWDESAIEFLLEKGFSPHLGARPIKRAIEQYLLAPLAITIVNNQFPDGDQFLFIKRNDNNLQVDFIDPDLPEVDWKERKQAKETQTEKAKSLTLKTIAFEPKGNLAEIEALQTAFEKLRGLTESEEWSNRKEHLLFQMSEPGFWSRKDRRKYLSEIEYRDRFEQSLVTVASVLERFSNLKKKYSTFSMDLVKQVAERILLMELSLQAFERNETQDAVIRIFYEQPKDEDDDEQAAEFWKRITLMYVQWAKNRKMKHRVVYQNMSDECFEFIMVVEGFAAYQVLEKEKGVHVWEEGTREGKYERIKLRADVRVFPEELAAKDSKEEMIKKLFDAPASDVNKITRKYRSKPSPLVSDNVSRWRSGRLDKISAGDFDLVE